MEHLQKAYKDNVEVRDLACTLPSTLGVSLALFSTCRATSTILVYVVMSFRLCMQEYERKFSVWLDNLEFVHSHNEKDSTFKVRRVICIVLIKT